MNDEYAVVAGQIENCPSKDELAQVLLSAGYEAYVGRYSIRLEEFDRFSFQELGSDPRTPYIDANHRNVSELIAFSQRVSRTLADAHIKHVFEIYDANEELAAYLHHNWPKAW
ncbi:hypothetical protein [Halocynthiibacter sp.]|uniref:hypothetical protein n=1 Tax=Halocynthiibacter sp. TaxID=1979210 RepID=UPI003C3EF0D1